MTTTQTPEGIVIKVRRYTLTGRPGTMGKLCYEYTTPVDITWNYADGTSRPGPRAGSYVDHGSGLSELRSMLRRKFGRNITIIETWK